PRALMALISARMPAPPEGSTPAMVKELGIILQSLTVQRLQKTLLGGAGICTVILARNAASAPGFAAGFDRFFHGRGHEDGVVRAGDGGVHKYAVTTEFHGDGGVGRGAYAGIHQHRDAGLVDDESQVPRVENAHG